MNSRNKIILGCLSLLVMASVGYALFSEKIVVNGNARAKSDMDVVVTQCKRSDIKVTEEEIKAMGMTGQINPGYTDPNAKNYGEGHCEIIQDKTIKTTTSLKKPGDRISYSIFIKNNGMNSIRIKEVNSNNNSGGKNKDTYYVEGFKGDYTIDGNPLGTGPIGSYTLMELNDGFPKYPDFNFPYDASSDKAIESNNITIKPKESIFLIVENSWTLEPNFPAVPLEGVKMNYDIQFVFEQVNN